MNWRSSSVAIASLACALPASAIDVEKLVMPGPVIAGHADVEADCTRCHRPFRTQEQRDLCLDCHTDVAADQRAGEGFHGRATGAAEAECRSCHTDHQGRDADIVALGPETFDHDLTDYPLKGAHRRAACEGCHALDTKHRDASHACADCHGDEDIHHGSLGTSCGDCHNEQAWADARFDHDKTQFPLVGRHRDTDCALCHPAARYKNAATDCRSCHSLDDVHLGRFGPDCGSCHSATGWKATKFDHDRDTHFALRGAHRTASCESCHGTGKLERLSASDCVDCHRADDEHRGRYGPRCDRCHGESSWKSTIFDHDQSTDFPLRGKHRDIECRGCHTGVLSEEKLDATCGSCHQADDVHKGQQGSACADCHNESGWTNGVFFDHDLTRFPLLGLHAAAACEQCHLSPRFKEAGLACSGCHDDDVHLGRLGSACEQCHNPNGWRFWRFDHDTQTTFALHGAHADLECHDCHRTARTAGVRLGVGCESCHSRDDVHFGAFGHDCARCHGDESWQQVEMIR